MYSRESLIDTPIGQLDLFFTGTLFPGDSRMYQVDKAKDQKTARHFSYQLGRASSVPGLLLPSAGHWLNCTREVRFLTILEWGWE